MSEREDYGEPEPLLPKITPLQAMVFLLGLLVFLFTCCCATPMTYFYFAWEK